MELHKAIKEIVASKGPDMICNLQIINYLLDYQAFKEKPATKLILRDVINAGYGESILALQNVQGWQIKLQQLQHDFIVSCGYKEDLVAYVFLSIAYGLGLQVDTVNQEESCDCLSGSEDESLNQDIGSPDILDIMRKAREGDKESILYCAQNKIDPFYFDSNFFFDYQSIRIGDWVYDDGSFSRTRSDLKNCVGVVFSLKTSPLEQQDGWTHGLIVAVRDAAEREWGEYGDLSYPHTHYTSKDLELLKDSPESFKDYQTEYLLRDSDIETFKIARTFALGLPKGKTSGWYLPSISQLRLIAVNLPTETLNTISMNSSKSYLSSSQSNANEVCSAYISTDFGGKTYYSFDTVDKQSPFYRVRPIAAF